MIFIPKFSERFVGKKYKVSGDGTEWTAEGYGDNDANGNPFLIGSLTDSKGTQVRTHLLKNIEFTPNQGI